MKSERGGGGEVWIKQTRNVVPSQHSSIKSHQHHFLLLLLLLLLLYILSRFPYLSRTLLLSSPSPGLIIIVQLNTLASLLPWLPSHPLRHLIRQNQYFHKFGQIRLSRSFRSQIDLLVGFVSLVWRTWLRDNGTDAVDHNTGYPWDEPFYLLGGQNTPTKVFSPINTSFFPLTGANRRRQWKTKIMTLWVRVSAHLPSGTLKRFEASLLKTLWVMSPHGLFLNYQFLVERDLEREGKLKYSSSHSRKVYTHSTLREGYPPILPWRGAAVEVGTLGRVGGNWLHGRRMTRLRAWCWCWC